jgi:hypothetical protein
MILSFSFIDQPALADIDPCFIAGAIFQFLECQMDR